MKTNEFVDAPAREVTAVAPETVIYQVGGTRRAAALAGIRQADYLPWNRRRMIDCLRTIFEHGVEHIIHPAIGPTSFAETTGGYQERLVGWIADGLAGEEALSDYQKEGWRVRIITDEAIPEFKSAVQVLEAATPENYSKTLWVHIIPNHDWFFRELLTKIEKNRPRTKSDLIRTLYGMDVPEATLYIGHGKPSYFSDMMPIACGNIQCYWTQKLGYSLSEHDLRQILYDFAYTRKTWTADKSNRTQDPQAILDSSSNQIIGLGERVGPFWRPK